MKIPHIPVLKEAVVDAFKDIKGKVVDATLGYGGHSEALLQSNPNIEIIGIDRDQEAIEFSKKRLEPFKERISFIKAPFSEGIKKALERGNIKGVLADIGVSSLQLDKKERGFGFDSEILDMRMDQSAPLSAYDVVNEYSKEDLQKIFKEYGELKNASKIAQAIVQNRPFRSAKELSSFLAKILPKSRKIHPATLIFQAIRIEVNKELDELQSLLDILEKSPPVGGRLAIITFHSLEDRIVKNRFKKWAKSCICPPEAMRCSCGANHALGKILTKKPIVATAKEIEENPRSRSAKLRIFEFAKRE